jgi:hypothetical protein
MENHPWRGVSGLGRRQLRDWAETIGAGDDHIMREDGTRATTRNRANPRAISSWIPRTIPDQKSPSTRERLPVYSCVRSRKPPPHRRQSPYRRGSSRAHILSSRSRVRRAHPGAREVPCLFHPLAVWLTCLLECDTESPSRTHFWQKEHQSRFDAWIARLSTTTRGEL